MPSVRASRFVAFALLLASSCLAAPKPQQAVAATTSYAASSANTTPDNKALDASNSANAAAQLASASASRQQVDQNRQQIAAQRQQQSSGSQGNSAGNTGSSAMDAQQPQQPASTPQQSSGKGKYAAKYQQASNNQQAPNNQQASNQQASNNQQGSSNQRYPNSVSLSVAYTPPAATGLTASTPASKVSSPTASVSPSSTASTGGDSGACTMADSTQGNWCSATSACYADDTQFQSSCLNSTNVWRSKYNAKPLAWNASLVDFAQTQVDKCIYQHTEDQGITNPNGENIAHNWDSPTSIIDGFGGEVAQYQWNSPTFNEATGHFSQLVWQHTTTTGCARKWCGGQNGVTGWLVFCEYNPPGNYPNMFASNVNSPNPAGAAPTPY